MSKVSVGSMLVFLMIALILGLGGYRVIDSQTGRSSAASEPAVQTAEPQQPLETPVAIPANLALLNAPDGTIAAAELISSYDTPAFVAMVVDSPLFTQLKGLKGEAVLNVKTVSGATMSSNSFLSAAYAALQEIQPLLEKQ